MSRVGETGVGEMGIGETGVGEMGVGETGPNHNYIIKLINIYTLNWLSGASSMFESPSQQAPDSRNRRRDRSVCTGQYANNTVEVQPVSYALPNCPGPAKWEKHHKTTFLS